MPAKKPQPKIPPKIDWMFSRYSTALGKHNAVTLPELHSIIAQSYTPAPRTVHVTSVWDMKELIQGHVGTMHGHADPHIFRFTMDNDGEVKMGYKEWPTGKKGYKYIDLGDGFVNAYPLKLPNPKQCIPLATKYLEELNTLEPGLAS